MPKINVARLATLIILPLLLSACTRHQIEGGVPESELVVVRVDNQNLSLVRVYASKGGIQQWIGTVSSGSVARLTVPGALIQYGAPTSITLSAEAVQTGGRYNTPLIVVRPGSVVSLQIDQRLNFSTWNQQ